MKQDKLFCEGESRHRRSLVQMQSCGHFEFGLDRRAINFGDREAVNDVEGLWNGGAAARGWALYWSKVYGYLAQRLAANAELREATQVVWFEELCEQPLAMVQAIAEHCDLPNNVFLCQQLASKLHAPTYYRPSFTRAEEAAIEEETEVVVRLLQPKTYQPAAAWKRAA